VGGQATKDTVRLASKGAQLVVYGTATKEDVRVPTFLLVFKDIHVRGFWRTGWFNSSTLEERTELLDELVRLMVRSKVTSRACCRDFDRTDYFGRCQFQEPVHEIVKIEGTLSDEEATLKVREIFERVNKGTGGTKIILDVESPQRL